MEQGIKETIAAKKPLFANIQKHLKFAREHKHWTADDRKKVLYSEWTSPSLNILVSILVLMFTEKLENVLIPDALAHSKHSGNSIMVFMGKLLPQYLLDWIWLAMASYTKRQ